MKFGSGVEAEQGLKGEYVSSPIYFERCPASIAFSILTTRVQVASYCLTVHLEA